MAGDSFEEKLIEEVRNRPTIWDRRSKNYNNRTMHDKEWLEVSSVLGCSKDACKSKWRNLRDVFMKEMKKPSSRWSYFHRLTFLRDVAPSNTRIKEEPYDEEEHTDDLSGISERSETGSHFMDIKSERGQSPDIVNVADFLPPLMPNEIVISPQIDVSSSERAEPSRKRQKTSENSDTSRGSTSGGRPEEENRPELEDDDMLYLRSLAPYFRHLPPVQKLRLRSKIESLMADEIGNYTSS